MAERLRWLVRPSLRSASLLLAFEGWNDAGQAASAAVRFVEAGIQAVPLAEIDCEEFYDFTVERPTVRLAGGSSRVVEWPDLRLRYGAAAASRDLVTGCAPEPHLRWRSFADSCLELVRGLRLERVVLLGAYLADVVYSRPVRVTGFASDPALLQRIGVVGSGYEGPTGIVGVLGDAFRSHDIEVVSLWAGLPHYISASPNPRGTLALVQKLIELLDVRFDCTGLVRDAASFEEQVSALVAADPELGEYVRQLKKREFAQ